MNISELSSMLADRVDDVCHKIFPSGKREGAEYCVGSLAGEAGKSLKVRLSGSKRGIWADFETGETGDLVDLWREAFNLSMPEALSEIKSYLGVLDEREQFKKTYSKPVIPKNTCQLQGKVLEFLTEDRKLTNSILKYKIGQAGDYILFPFLFGDQRKMLKQRNVKDKKDQRPTSADQEPCLFGWQAIPDAQRVGYICEGELDAMAMYDYGYPALSVPFGGGPGAKQGNWIENEFHNLERFEEIYLCLDDDEAGQEAQKEIIKRLGADRCKVVTLPRKDANQCLIDGIEKPEIDKAIRNAKTLDPEELKSAHCYTDKVIKLLHPDGNHEPGFFSPWAKCRNQFYFRYSELSISNGVNGHGKSQIVGHMILAAMAQGERACIASMELKPERLLARLTRQAGGLSSGMPSAEYIQAISSWYKERLWVYGCIGTAKTKRLLETFVYARKRYGVKVFVIDSLMMCGIGEDDYNAQKAFIQQICDFKNEHDCHVFLVTHSRKGESEDKPTGKFDVKGTGAITDLADNVFTIWRNKKKEDELNKPEHLQNSDITERPDAILACHKQRNGDWEGKVALWFDKNCFQYLPSENARPIQYVDFSVQEAV